MAEAPFSPSIWVKLEETPLLAVVRSSRTSPRVRLPLATNTSRSAEMTRLLAIAVPFTPYSRRMTNPMPGAIKQFVTARHPMQKSSSRLPFIYRAPLDRERSDFTANSLAAVGRAAKLFD
jgi:hypothetical protein